MPTALRATPLASRHRALGARMVEFNGWEMPLRYEGILAEHHATRRAVTVFDTCHMARFLVSGPTALDDLARLLTADVRAMTTGQCRYGFLLREDGGVLDDLITYRLCGGRWLVVANAGTHDKDLAWLSTRVRTGTQIEDLTDTLGKLDVQGPQAPALVRAVLGVDLAGLRRFHSQPFVRDGADGLVSRAGNLVRVADAEVGRVTSGSFSPTLGCAIGFALVAREHARPGAQLAIDTGRGALAAELVEPPFYRRPRSPQPPAAGTEAGPPAPPLS